MREFQFYIVPTPIGNIQDITYRAVEILKSVDLIACEDTRTTQKLLNHYDIKTKCVSYHKYNEKERVDFFLNEINSGKKIALVSDAGTPMICDPGEVIIKELIKNDISFTALPGACAVTTFLSQVPRKNEEFTFIGFLPRTQKQIEDVVQKYSSQNMVFYDSPERILKSLAIIKSIRPNVRVALGRELSKLFEEIVIDDIDNVIEHYNDGIKGEIVCMLYADEGQNDIDIDSKIKALKSKGYKDKDIAQVLSAIYNLGKNDVYKRSLSL
ncbi:MAG: 16S rRNA (cytidine(1402)-2'-O)-methyltransferase [bacterium]|nr:16S rRNA (cytidine(1402)-2'-O)-methyltransferase [bacterium]